MANQEKRDPSIVRRFLLTAKLELESPLLIGAGESDNLTDTLVLKNKNGNPFIPGTSLAGVLRSCNNDVETLFGDFNKSQSTVVVSDVKLKNTKTVVRDGVKISPITNVGEKGAKFDYEAVERGATGNLQIVAHVRQYQDGNIIKEQLKKLGSLLQTGIRVGALTRRGFGKIVCEEVMLYDYDFSDVKNVQAWLLHTFDKPIISGEPVKIDETKKLAETDFVMELSLNIKTSLLVRSDDFEESDYKEFIKKEKDKKTPVSSVQMKSLDSFVIPGPSVRGVIKNRAVKILRALNIYDEGKLNDLFGYASEDGQSQRGRVITEEVYFDNAENYPQSRNRIDRFTGGTVDGALMTNFPVLQKKTSDILTMKIVVEDCNETEAGLMLLVAKDICTGQVAFGGEKSIGRGVMNGVEVKVDYQGKTYGISCGGEKIIVSPGNIEDLEKYVEVLCDGGLNGKD